MSKFKDTDGNIINVPVYVDERAIFNRVFVDVNKISTVFGRNAFRDYINRQVQKKELVRIKNKSTQTSERPALIAGGYEMDASANSIPQNSEKSTENSKKVSDERKSKKVYRRAEASATLEEAVKEHLEFTDAYAKLRGRSKKEATDILWKALNTAEGEERRRAALDVADFVLDNAVVEAFGEDPMAQENARTVAILRDYMHKLDLDGIKGEIRNRFGKNNAIHLVWGKREGEVGVAPDSIKNELIEQGITITASNPADIFFEIYDAYQSAKAGLESHAKILLKNGLGKQKQETELGFLFLLVETVGIEPMTSTMST